MEWNGGMGYFKELLNIKSLEISDKEELLEGVDMCSEVVECRIYTKLKSYS